MPPGTDPLAGKLYIPSTTRNLTYIQLNYPDQHSHWTLNDWNVMIFIPLQNSFYEQPLRTTLYFVQFLLKARAAVGLPDFVLQILAELKIGYGIMDLEIFIEHTLPHELQCINHRQNVTLESA
jgi:hypothetical protein